MRVTATMRFQRRLRDLLESRKATIDKAAYGTLADICGKPQSWVSNVLSDVRQTQPDLEDLENIADFFRVSVSSLLRPTTFKELSPDEQRMVLAFRAVPEAAQTHFMALLEAASLSENEALRKRLRQLKKSSITAEVYPSAQHGARPNSPLSATDLAALRDRALSLSVELAAIFGSPTTDQSAPSADAQKPDRRGPRGSLA